MTRSALTANFELVATFKGERSLKEADYRHFLLESNAGGRDRHPRRDISLHAIGDARSHFWESKQLANSF